ncbi:MAG TPA: hypothetical protein VFO16_05425 [Pseudonocardiaceae bacterium]|nr:hypothetical protein [Pseudonocardiaceae bacterium]
MSVTIDWGALGVVFLASFGAAVGVIVLFSLGISTLAIQAAGQDTAPGGGPARPPWAWPVSMLCFLACGLVVAYGLYLIIIK